MLKDEIKVALRIPEILIPKGSMYEGKILNVSLVIPKEDMSFKDVLIDADAIVEEITKRILDEVRAALQELPAQLEAEKAEIEKSRMEAYIERRRA